MKQDIYLKIIIPCYKEPDILQTLGSLSNCTLPKNKVDVIVLINHAINTDVDTITFNQQTFSNIQNWVRVQENKNLQILPLLVEIKEQSVGLARKTGMDLAYKLFENEQHTSNGIMICLDADCTVEKNYLNAIETHFLKHTKTPAASIYYEHNLLTNKLIADYELHLRYLVNALRWAGHPYAFQTVGSSMAVRVEAYKKQGGMNTRQAGEDFYFLQKMMDLGGFSDILTTTVYPSARISDRVPFGTGRAMQQIDNLESWLSYDFRSYRDLKQLIDFVPSLYDGGIFEPQSEALSQFLKTIAFDTKCLEIKQNTSNLKAFEKRFFQYFNGFQVMKFLNFCKADYYPAKAITEAIEPFLQLVFPNQKFQNSNSILLEMRIVDKNKASS